MRKQRYYDCSITISISFQTHLTPWCKSMFPPIFKDEKKSILLTPRRDEQLCVVTDPDKFHQRHARKHEKQQLHEKHKIRIARVPIQPNRSHHRVHGNSKERGILCKSIALVLHSCITNLLFKGKSALQISFLTQRKFVYTSTMLLQFIRERELQHDARLRGVGGRGAGGGAVRGGRSSRSSR